MDKKEMGIKIFENQNVRTVWNEEKEKWYFSIVDVCGVLTEQSDTRGATFYWSKLKQRLNEEGSELLTNCQQFKMLAEDGKMRVTDVADTEQLLRLVQSIPSKKAEPFKVWLAKVGSERLDEIVDPEIAIQRAVDTYKRKGYSDEWISNRLQSVDIRKELTNEWDRCGVEKQQYAILTNINAKAWSGKTTKEYKRFKDLKNENLRDNMTRMELILTMLAEESTTTISKVKNPKTFGENAKISHEGGTVAKKARLEIESQTGQSVISAKNAKDLKKLK
jgi:hypothetical protein